MLISDPQLKQLGEDKMAEWRRWFDNRLDNAIEAATTQQHPEIESKKSLQKFSKIISSLSFELLYFMNVI